MQEIEGAPGKGAFQDGQAERDVFGIPAKVDQGAILVAEFSELQGFAASHYARMAGRSDDVADAIARIKKSQEGTAL